MGKVLIQSPGTSLNGFWLVVIVVVVVVVVVADIEKYRYNNNYYYFENQELTKKVLEDYWYRYGTVLYSPRTQPVQYWYEAVSTVR